MQEQMKKRIELLAKDYNYKPLPQSLSIQQRQIYRDMLPNWVKMDGDTCILYTGSLPIATGYSRVVIGDYGAYIEIPPRMILPEHLKIKPGEEFRLNEYYKGIKYIWLCPITAEDIKIYWQKRTVKYADYIPEMFYISPYEVNNGTNEWNGSYE